MGFASRLTKMPELPAPSYFLSLPEGKINLFRRASAALACLLEWSRQRGLQREGNDFPLCFPPLSLNVRRGRKVVEGSQGSE